MNILATSFSSFDQSSSTTYAQMKETSFRLFPFGNVRLETF